MKTQNLAANILIWSALLIGILLLFSGLKGTIERKTLSGGYETAEGHFFDYEIYSEGGYDAIRHRYTNDTYRLIYTYRVNGRDYTVSTDMGTGMIPDYGSVKTVRYNPDQPDDAFLEGPNRHGFKIFFGLFFIAIPSFFLWLLKPEKKEEKKEKKTSLDGIGMAIGLALMVFSYGMLYFITGELSLRGMINFYRTSFILPMAAPVLLMAAGGYLLIRSLFLGRKKAGRTGKTEEAPKYKVRTIAGCILIACLFLFFSAGGESLYGGSKFLPEGNREQTEGNAAEKADFAAVHAMLSERGFETANITTTYWFYDENKITNVVSGIKGGTAFEFYEYTDGETTDGVYNRISYDVSRELEPDEREKYERMLQGGGKRFDFTENGVSSIVVYQGNIVIYAYFPEEEHEIQDMLEELGVDS